MKLPEWTLDRVGEANQPKTERALSEFLRFQCSQTKRSEVGHAELRSNYRWKQPAYGARPATEALVSSEQMEWAG
jgi:hypothetical protein